jgi:hypothetical protein
MARFRGEVKDLSRSHGWEMLERKGRLSQIPVEGLLLPCMLGDATIDPAICRPPLFHTNGPRSR